jgi:hypothetical protein
MALGIAVSLDRFFVVGSDSDAWTIGRFGGMLCGWKVLSYFVAFQ